MGAAGRITFQQIVAAVQRMPGLESISLGEIMDGVKTAAIDIGNQPWPWNYAETNILVPAPISTGTVSITDGQVIVTGSGTNWASIVGAYQSIGWRIRFGTNNLDYMVNTVISPTSLTLVQNINLGSSLSDTSYTLYKDSFTYPADYILGSDVGLYQPTIRTRIPKIPRSKFEEAMNSGLRSFSTNISMFYCNQGSVAVDVNGTKNFQMRIAPPPSQAAELRLCYHRIADTFTSQGTLVYQSDLPDGYDEIIQLVAASRLYDTMRQPGLSAQVKSLAEGKLKLLKRAISTETIDDVPDPNVQISDSSISQWGMTIARM